MFAGVTSSGSLLVYNSRIPARALVKAVAHSGNATAIDWHPSRPDVVATGGSSDRCVKIWRLDLDSNGDAQYNNMTINSNTLMSRGAESVATTDSSGNESQGAQSTVTSGPVTILYQLSIAASVTRLRWRPPEESSLDPIAAAAEDRHDAMLAVATASVQGGAAGGSGLVGLWSFRRPFMALSVVEGHTEGAVTDFLWLDTPPPPPQASPQPTTTSPELLLTTERGRRRRRKVVGSSSWTLSSDNASRVPSYVPHETDSIIYDNSDTGDLTKDEHTVGIWQHILSVGRDGRCLLQSFARGMVQNILECSPSLTALNNFIAQATVLYPVSHVLVLQWAIYLLSTVVTDRCKYFACTRMFRPASLVTIA